MPHHVLPPVARRGFMFGFGSAVALSVAAPAVAAAAVPDGLASAGILEFGPDNVLFVGDTVGAAVHAFALRPSDLTDQAGVALGNQPTFNGRDLIAGIDRQIAGLLGTSIDDIDINDMKVHRPSRQIFLSVHRGRGPGATPLILKVNHGRLEVLELAGIPHTKCAIATVPSEVRLEFGQQERRLAITDITWHDGEILVTGVSNEEFASTLRRIPFPFDGTASASSIQIWHAVHAEFETRAPIIRQLVRNFGGVAYVIAVYACTPLVRIPLAALKNGAHVHGEMIGELGFGNTPIDMVAYTDPGDSKDYILVTHNQRNATRVAVSDIGRAAPLPENVPNLFTQAGVPQFPIPLSGAEHLDMLDDAWAVAIRRHPADPRRLDLHTLPLPFFFDRADHIVEMNFPGGPDPFGYHTAKAR